MTIERTQYGLIYRPDIADKLGYRIIRVTATSRSEREHRWMALPKRLIMVADLLLDLTNRKCVKTRTGDRDMFEVTDSWVQFFNLHPEQRIISGPLGSWHFEPAHP